MTTWSSAEHDPAYAAMNHRLLDLAQVDATMAVADIGSGPGTMLRLLDERGCRPASAWSVEPDPDMRAIASMRVPWARVVDGHLEHFDAVLPPSAIDRVVIANCIHLADDLAAVFANARAVLRPSGLCAFSTGYHDDAARPGDADLYLKLALRAQRTLIRQGLRPARREDKPMATRPLSGQQLLDAAGAAGLRPVSVTSVDVPFTLELTLGTLGSPMFASATFPSVPVAAAVDALCQAARSLHEQYPERRLTRNYLLATVAPGS